tara:strand:+ start:2372 stop:3352 length:981 start_codon:yes stop_codon:yes gene_type:complete
MILKFFEIKKINIDINKFILFYGKNEGLKNQNIKEIIKGKKGISYYDEKEILENSNDFIEDILTKSLFEKEKTIIIKRGSDKILKIIKEIASRDVQDLSVIISAENLDKKSKLRNFYEKDKKCICIAFYPDNDQTLSKLAYNYFSKRDISISTANINLIISKCNGDRENLINEIKKIEVYIKEKKQIKSEDIIRLTNLIENYNISELVDNCLAKNKKKIIHILNENNFSNEDCIIIIRSFLTKSKKILQLSKQYEINKNIDLTISSAKPPIFWKDKEITKQQIYKWSSRNISRLIYKLNDLELNIKKNINNSIDLICDFILDQTSN